MAHFFSPSTRQATDFFVLKACGTIRAALWNVGGPPLTISSDDGRIATVSTSSQFGRVVATADIFEFFITGTTPGNILIRARSDAGAQWAFTQAVVGPGDVCLNAVGPAVQEIQERLNQKSPTRLPRLTVNGRFDTLVKARAMEFQFLQGINADGIVGPKTRGKLMNGSGGRVSPPAGRCIFVDLVANVLIAFNAGLEELRASPIHGGSASDPSTQGVFPMTSRRLRNHTSSKFPEPPGNMNFSLFYHGAEALHQGPGRLESHGCIHVSPPSAETLFNWAGSHDVLVIVVK